jgi:hypothetical protein
MDAYSGTGGDYFELFRALDPTAEFIETNYRKCGNYWKLLT